MKRAFAVALGIAVVTALAVGCNRKQEQMMMPPPPEVQVYKVQPQRIALTTELPGRATSFRVSEVRPQVSGLILKRLFTEGSDVKAGDVLYEIDPAPFKAAYSSALANVAAAKKQLERAEAALNAGIANVARQKATLELAKTNGKRLEDLFAEQAVSASERDQAVTAVTVAESGLLAAEAQVESDRAGVAAAKATIEQAEAAAEMSQINLGYTSIKAPISGRIGRSSVTEGATVIAYQPVALATIQQLDPIYVDVPRSTADLHRLQRHGEARNLLRADQASVNLVLEDGSKYPHAGVLKFRDVTVDPTTGSVIVRIEIPNPDSTLLPGMFVRAIVEEGANEQAILVPQQAVTRDPKGNAMAMIVDAGNKVQPRMVTADRAIGNQWLISSGLEAGDRVVVEGLQKIRPGVPVTIAGQAATQPATTAASTPAHQ